MRLVIDRTWDDKPAGAEVVVQLTRTNESLAIEVDAPFHDDPPPMGPPGSTPRLWDHEVVEVFFLGDDERYLEVELSPHGHHLVLELHGVRQVVREALPLDYEAEVQGTRWRGLARLPIGLLPCGWSHVNAFAVSGTGDSRRHLAWRPAGGPSPDFHRLDAFDPVFPHEEE